MTGEYINTALEQRIIELVEMEAKGNKLDTDGCYFDGCYHMRKLCMTKKNKTVNILF